MRNSDDLIAEWRERAEKITANADGLTQRATIADMLLNRALTFRECADELAALAAPSQTPPKPIRAHVIGCPKALRVPVDLCECGGRDFLTDHQRGVVTPGPPTAQDDKAI